MGEYLGQHGNTVLATRDKAVLSAAWNWGRQTGVTALPNPCTGVRGKRSKDTHYVPDADLQAVSACGDVVLREALELLYLSGANPKDMLTWRAGMRRMEGLHLRWKDCGKDGVRILSTGEERTKSGEWRDIPLSKGAAAALEQLRGLDAEFVLPRITPPSISRAFDRSVQRAGLDGSLHTLRHTYISHLVMAGVPLRTVQIYAGHAHYTTTEGYAYLMPATVPKQVSRLSI